MSIFGDWLQGQLDAKGWSQADLERASGVSSAQISRIISGTRGVEAESLRAFAKALGMSQAELFYAAGLQTEKPGAPVLADPILADIWNLLETMSEDDKRAARVLLERMFPRGESDGRREPANSGASGKTKRG